MNRRRFLLVTACAALPARAWAAPQEWRGRAMGADVTLRLRGASPTQARSFLARRRGFLPMSKACSRCIAIRI
ncbi:hypothetical protein ACFSS8_09800 [Paracoccus kondratievae]